MITENKMIEFENEDEDDNYDRNMADMEEAIFPQENRHFRGFLSMWEKVYNTLDSLGITGCCDVNDHLFKISFKTSTAIRSTHCVIYYISYTIIS